MTINQASVSLEDAQRVIAAGQAKAGEIGSPSNVAVVDAGGNIVSHTRMDRAWVGSVNISINKAFAARAFDIAAKELGENTQPGEQFYGIQGFNHGRAMIFAGGIPLRQNGQVVGAVGVRWGSGDQDRTLLLRLLPVRTPHMTDQRDRHDIQTIHSDDTPAFNVEVIKLSASARGESRQAAAE